MTVAASKEEILALGDIDPMFAANKPAPILDRHLYSLISRAFNPDPTSELWACFDHRRGHVGLPRAYFQVCGMDIFRYDGLIYERVLRKEVGVQTRMDVCKGLSHSWRSMFLEMEASTARMDDSVTAVKQLLGRTEAENMKGV